MKQTLFILIALSLCAVLAAQQNSFTYESNELEGAIYRAYSFQNFNLGAVTVQNSFTGKWSQDITDLELYYVRNYMRDQISLIYTGRGVRLAVHGGGEKFGDNIPSHIAGLASRWDATHGVFGGAEASLHYGAAELDLRADWWGQWFEQTAVGAGNQNDEEDFLDTNLWSEGKLAWRFGDWLKPYVRYELFSDMNELDAYNQLAVSVGDEVSRKLNYLHMLTGSFEFTHDNTFENDQNSLQLDARLMSRWNLDWMLVNHVSIRQWLDSGGDGDDDDEEDGDDDRDDDEDEGGEGQSSYEGFVETLAQRVLKLDGNHLSRVQFGGRVWPGDETGYIKADLLYWIGVFSLYLDAQKNFNGGRNHKLIAQVSAALLHDRLTLSYAYQLDDRETQNDVTSHFVRMELKL